MESITLYLGSKSISSSSLRAWLMLLQTGADFKAVIIELDQPTTAEKIAQISPTKKVPVLQHGDFLVWESLSIGEYLAEIFPKAKLWPTHIKDRAFARSISSEMLCGFANLQNALPFNATGRFKNFTIPDMCLPDIERIIQIWKECRKKYEKKGPFLFGHFTIADAMFAPIVLRFLTYHISIPTVALKYVDAIMALPEVKMWCNDI